MVPLDFHVFVATCVFVIFQVIVQGKVCRNNIPNCSAYDKNDICTPGRYPQWTKENCEEFCGLCKRTTPCEDKEKNCQNFGSTGCNKPYVGWAQDNCEATCGFCKAPPCKDKKDNCKAYGDDACKEPYLAWAKDNCRKRCGFCNGPDVKTPATPSPPKRTSGVSGADKVTIINAINDARSKVQPPAKDMNKVIWDPKAADLAQKHVDTCVWGMPSNHKVDGYASVYATTNIAAGNPDWTRAVSSWVQAKDVFQYGKEPDSYLGKGGWVKIATYTQVVTNSVVRVGCGFNKCKDKGNGYYACSFIGGQKLTRPYESGDRCGSCPNSCKDGLCDCGGKLCLNGKNLDVNACTCK